MKISKCANKTADGLVTFILKILGAFGACWGSFSAASVAYKEFFGGPDDTNFMNNPIYAKTALTVSLSAATLSAYVIIRDKLLETQALKKTKNITEVDVTIPLCHSYNARSSSPLSANSEGIEIDPSFGKEQTPLKVICKQKNL